MQFNRVVKHAHALKYSLAIDGEDHVEKQTRNFNSSKYQKFSKQIHLPKHGVCGRNISSHLCNVYCLNAIYS